MTTNDHTFLLIPWHIGNMLDVTLNTARSARNIRVFLAEEPELTRRQFENDLKIDCSGKEFLLIPERPDAAFLKTVQAMLRKEDVGLICSGGIPCFIDPGGWLVRRLRKQGVPITALAGASILSTMLSLSGFEWPREFSRGTFVIYLDDDPRGVNKEIFLEAMRRDSEPSFVFLNVRQFRECVSAMRPVLGKRPVTAFFDLTKVPRSKFPYADRMITLTCDQWLKEEKRTPWESISDVALMVHPRETPA